MEQLIRLFSYIRRSPREFFIWFFLSFFIILSVLLLLRLNGIIGKFSFIDSYLVFVEDNSDDGKYLCIEGNINTGVIRQLKIMEAYVKFLLLRQITAVNGN